MNQINTREEAVAYVAAVMHSPPSLLSPVCAQAFELCERFELTARDLLTYRRERAKAL